MNEQIIFLKNILECWSTVIDSQVNLYCSIARLIIDNDRELKALRNSHNIVNNRLEKVERALQRDF